MALTLLLDGRGPTVENAAEAIANEQSNTIEVDQI
jgi:hypothetical protein